MEQVIIIFQSTSMNKTLSIAKSATLAQVKQEHFPQLADAYNFVYGGRNIAENETFNRFNDTDRITIVKAVAGN